MSSVEHIVQTVDLLLCAWLELASRNAWLSCDVSQKNTDSLSAPDLN